MFLRDCNVFTVLQIVVCALPYIFQQIVYLGDTRYTESYQIGHVSLPPSSSSLVYVSAIHNAGHFYVQVR